MTARTCITLLLCTLAGILASPIAQTDTIALKSGDRLSGTLLQISSGIISFRTELAGRIMVPHDQVIALDTESFLVLALNNDEALPGRIVTIDGQILLASPDGRELTKLNLARIQDIEQMPVQEEKSHAGKSTSALSASIETGYQLRSGSKNASGPTVNLGLTHKGDTVTTQLSTAFEYTEDAGSANRFMSSELAITSNTEKLFRPTLIIDAERDRNRALDYRLDAAAGVTAVIAGNDVFELEGFAGAGATLEKFDPDTLRRDLGSSNDIPASASEKRREELNLDLRMRYTRDFFFNSTITELLTLKPSLTNMGELRTGLESSISVPIIFNLKLNFDLLFDYESETRYNDIDKWNTAISAGLRLEF